MLANALDRSRRRGAQQSRSCAIRRRSTWSISCRDGRRCSRASCTTPTRRFAPTCATRSGLADDPAAIAVRRAAAERPGSRRRARRRARGRASATALNRQQVGAARREATARFYDRPTLDVAARSPRQGPRPPPARRPHQRRHRRSRGLHRRVRSGLPRRARPDAGATRRSTATPGHAYVYLNYGIHYLVNVVTEAARIAGGGPDSRARSARRHRRDAPAPRPRDEGPDGRVPASAIDRRTISVAAPAT